MEVEKFSVLTFYSGAHSELFEKFFKKSFPNPDWIEAIKLDLPGDAEYYSEPWKVAMSFKPRMISQFIETMPEQSVFFYSDADVQFLPAFSCKALLDLFRKSGCDILFQKEHRDPSSKEVNAGICMGRTCPNLLRFFQKVIAEISNEPNDQIVVNSLLGGDPGISWGHLPLTYYARSQGFPPPRDATLHHANVTVRKSTATKLRQLQLIRKMFYGGSLGWYAGILDEARVKLIEKGSDRISKLLHRAS